MDSFSDAIENKRRGMVLPFEPLSMAFEEIKYSVDMPQVAFVFRPLSLIQFYRKYQLDLVQLIDPQGVGRDDQGSIPSSCKNSYLF